MKNQSSLHRLLHFIKTELEVTLAVLVLLAFVVGFSFAQTPTSQIAAEITAAQAADGSQLVIGTTSYSGIIFGSSQTAGYKIVTKLTGGAQYYDTTGITLVDTSSEYKYTQTLAQPLDSKLWYVDFTGSPTKLTLNGQPVTSPAQGIALAGATALQLSATGNLTLRSISHTAGTATNPQTKIDSIASLFIAPATTQISVGASRKFIVVALTSEGKSVTADDVVTWSSSNQSVATIDQSTGLLTAIAAGKVQITAKAGASTVSSATVTVMAAEDEPLITNRANNVKPINPVEPPIPFSQVEPPVPFTDKVEPPIPFVEPAIPFSDYLTQSQINETASKLPTPQQIVYRTKTAFTEIANTLTEITVGRDIVTSTGETIHRPSAMQRITSFFSNIF